MPTEFIHEQVFLRPEQILAVKVGEPARIRLLDPKNYRRFMAGRRYRYCGRSAPRTEVAIRPERPRSATWHLVVIPEDQDRINEAEVSLSLIN